LHFLKKAVFWKKRKQQYKIRNPFMIEINYLKIAKI
jgi:hypothetical protein